MNTRTSLLKLLHTVFIAFIFTINVKHGLAQTQLSPLVGIQDSIYAAFSRTFTEGNPSSIESVVAKLNTITNQNVYTVYWRAYAGYYISIHYLKFGDKKAANRAISKAIAIIESFERKNSELYALQAMLQSFSIQFVGGMAAAVISNQVKSNAQKAIAADSSNLRAWYVLATNDYYIPKMYGGRKNTEIYLKKAIAQPDQANPHPYMPTWGRCDAYALLTSLYIESGRCSEAQKVLNEGLRLFPNDYTLNQNATAIKEQCK